MLRTVLLSATLLLASFGASATDRLYTTNNNGGEIRITDEQTGKCTGRWFNAYVANTTLTGCATVGMFSRDANLKLAIIHWSTSEGDVVLVYPLEDFDEVQPSI